MNHQAFLQAIRDDPDDDTPRLVYADWLEEHGQEARAEFIRVQCELTRGVDDRTRYYDLLRRLRDLVVKHRPAWLGLLRSFGAEWLFERGFVDRVSLSLGDWLRCGGVLLEEHPIHRLTVGVPRGRVADLAGSPLLAALTSLEVQGLPGDEGLAALAGSPHLGRLRALHLPAAGVQSPGVEALAGSPLLGRLTTLNLARNAARDAGAEALAASPRAARLVTLDLSDNSIGPGGAGALAASPHLGALRTLRVSSNHLGREGLDALMRSPQLTGVTTIDARYNGWEASAIRELRRRYGGRLVV